MIDNVILVDAQDIPIGTSEKLDAHKAGLLHRAFSIILFNNSKEILLQQRAATKYHCPLLWANACCGHPKPGEETAAAAKRRLREELGIEASLKKTTEICYYLPLNNGLIEHEYTHIFTGIYEGAIHKNHQEVHEVMFKSIEELLTWTQHSPESFAPWFLLYLQKYRQNIFMW